MSELRQDPTTKEWVIIAKERARRPNDFVQNKAKPELPIYKPDCPFCPGNDPKTSDTLLYKTPDNEGWRVRVLTNLFPALTPDGKVVRKKEDNFFLSLDGVGIHEVIVETPIHNTSLAMMTDSEVYDVLRAYKERYKALSKLPFVKLIIIFKNNGQAAGTSLEHPHSQLIAAPLVPRHIRTRHEVAIRYYDDTGRSLYSDLVNFEIRTGKRIVVETDRYIVFHPFASHRPFETWIVPRKQQASFLRVSMDDLEALSNVLRVMLLKIYKGLNNPDFNYVIDSSPIGEEDNKYYTWHLRIIPRLTEVAGFEIGSGIFINTALPEETAQFLKEQPVG